MYEYLIDMEVFDADGYEACKAEIETKKKKDPGIQPAVFLVAGL